MEPNDLPEPDVEEMIENMPQAINFVRDLITHNIDTRIVDIDQGKNKIADVYQSAADVSPVGRLLESEDITSVQWQGNSLNIPYDPFEAFNLPLVIEQAVPRDAEQKLRTALVGTPFENLSQTDIDDIIKKGTSKASSSLKKVCNHFGKKLAEEFESTHNIIVKFGIDGGDFRIFGYFGKSNSGGLGAPVLSNDEAFARHLRDKNVKKITTATKATDDLDEASAAMKDSRSFAVIMSDAQKQLLQSSKKIENTGNAFQQFTALSGRPVLMKSSTMTADDDDD